jgi:hypothetical protein
LYEDLLRNHLNNAGTIYFVLNRKQDKNTKEYAFDQKLLMALEEAGAHINYEKGKIRLDVSDGRILLDRLKKSFETVNHTSQIDLNEVIELNASNFVHSGENCFYCPIPEIELYADSNENPVESPYRLMENGKFIGEPHSNHAVIRKQGGGIYSHWKKGIYFSTPDGSDPSKNKKSYSVIRVK